MRKNNIAFVIVLFVFIFSFISVVSFPGFASWENKKASAYYIDNALPKTGAANVVSAIVWDFRGFDTLGEETVLFTSLVGAFTVIFLRKR